MKLFLKLLTVLSMLAWAFLWVFQVSFMPVESALVFVVVLPMLLWPEAAAGLRRRVATVAAQWARHKRLAVVAVGLLPMLIRVALLPLMPVPDPVAHDEFSYLLAADTFAAGRLTNPTHELWPFFEAVHVNHEPTYGSKYPPGQGLVMALGQVLFGHPWFGVWLSVGLMCGAVCWALQRWLPPGWALFGGLLFAVRLGIVSYWMNSYWGGAVAAVGGALVVGACGGLRRRPTVSDGFLLGAGLLVLANSRPLEGLVVALPLAAFLAMDRKGGFAARRVEWTRAVVAPVLLILTPGLAAMGYYNWRATGDPLTLPYQVNRETYGVAPQVFFLGQEPGAEPSYHQASVRRYYAEWEVSMFEEVQSFKGLLQRRLRQGLRLWNFFGGPLLSIPLLLVPWAVRDRRMRMLTVACMFFFFVLCFVLWIMPHYLAPVLSAAWLLLVQATRHLYHWAEKGRPTGRFYVQLMPLLALLSVAGCVAETRLLESYEPPFRELAPCVCWGDHPLIGRARLEERLEDSGRKHLVLVRYAPEHVVDYEWVHNRAAIDESPVVWAHGAEPNGLEELLRYYADRQVWLLEADQEPVAVVSG